MWFDKMLACLIVQDSIWGINAQYAGFLAQRWRWVVGDL
jgi:hypothetical protein